MTVGVYVHVRTTVLSLSLQCLKLFREQTFNRKFDHLNNEMSLEIYEKEKKKDVFMTHHVPERVSRVTGSKSAKKMALMYSRSV